MKYELQISVSPLIESAPRYAYLAHMPAITRNLPWVPMLAVLSGFTALAAVPGSPQPLPTPFPEARYSQMSLRSPFAVATAAAAPAATPGFATQLYIDGVWRVGDSDFVAIKSRDPDQQNVIVLEVGIANADGLKADRVKWSDEMGKSTVDVSKDGEKATLAFDEANIKSAPAAPFPGAVGARLPSLPGYGNNGRPMNFPPPNGQPQFNNRFGAQTQPGQAASGPVRRVRGTILSGQ